MATITLYAGKINQMPGLINEVKKSVVIQVRIIRIEKENFEHQQKCM